MSQAETQYTELVPTGKATMVVSVHGDPTELDAGEEATEDTSLWALFAGFEDSEGRRLWTKVRDFKSGDEVSDVGYDEVFEGECPDFLINDGDWPSWYECVEVYYDPDGYVVLDPVIVEAHASADEEIHDPGVWLIPADKVNLESWSSRHPSFDEGEEIEPEDLPQF